MLSGIAFVPAAFATLEECYATNTIQPVQHGDVASGIIRS